MSNAISIDRIIKATLDGIDESMSIYQKWSGGEWLWNAPEYLLTIKIAENISKIKGSKFITLEDNVDYLLNLANAKGRGKISDKTRKNGRSDIVLWWANGTPRAIIEVKNSVYNQNKISNDINRIKAILKRKKSKSTLQFGLIAFYIDRKYKTKNAKENIENRIYEIFSEVKNKYPDITFRLYFRQKEIYEDNTSAWSSVVFLIKVK